MEGDLCFRSLMTKASCVLFRLRDEATHQGAADRRVLAQANLREGKAPWGMHPRSYEKSRAGIKLGEDRCCGRRTKMRQPADFSAGEEDTSRRNLDAKHGSTESGPDGFLRSQEPCGVEISEGRGSSARRLSVANETDKRRSRTEHKSDRARVSGVRYVVGLKWSALNLSI